MKTIKSPTHFLSRLLRHQKKSQTGFSIIQQIRLMTVVGILGSITPFIISNIQFGDERFVIVKVKNKYTTNVSEDDSNKRIDVQFEGDCTSDALVIEDFWSFKSGVNNSATLYANLDVGKTYELTIVGQRDPAWNTFPYVSAVIPLDRKINCPE